MNTISPYGSWKSPITSDLIVSGTVGLGQIAIDGDDIYWVEGRPSEAGRSVLVRRTPDGKITDVTPPPFNVRTRVHEYGGAAFAVSDSVVYFSHFADQRIYCQTLNSPPEPLTPAAKCCYADAIVDKPRNRLICVREDNAGRGESVNTIVSINLDNGEDIQILTQGNDFYASPRLSPDGVQLSWICWNHPNMPWDGTELWVAEINADGSLGEKYLVAGGVDESIFQPEWSPDGVLYFVSDKSNWWNFYRTPLNPPLARGEAKIEKSLREQPEIEPVCEMSAEFGLPQWVFGMSTYAFVSESKIICTYTQQGKWHLGSLDLATKQLTNIETGYTDISSVKARGETVVFLAGSPIASTAIVQLNLATSQRKILRKSSDLNIDSGYLSVPEPLEFPTENGLTAFGFFYPPKNQDFAAPESEKPPLVVKSHGGPTAATSSSMNLKIQYWTSRGFAVLDVNYGGSTGYGREYRRRLQDSWGIVDVDDCANGAKYLAEQGLVDGERMAIAGGSAGGYTTLCALTFRDVFKAGASYYGVSDLEALTNDTHKFEARYLDGLIGPYPARKDLYVARSPIHAAEGLSCPVIFFQGLEDKVVPPNQAEMMVEILKAKGLPVAYVAYEGEQHGFRRAENIKRTLDGEFYFYSRVFKFELAEPVEAVPIYNL
ncbi:MAG: S9 family peptidase [Microcoleus sp. PH2017_25_DOB_D_A]|uniref:S9 family peptidase n=1 Tax=unclassified Microcoleus TaxID=2642155 RepID=UPI001DBC691F|nr:MULTISPECIES: S9 family peptidase [unclassified Microcoleus]TAE16807.1 MAG: S9 family peptidase [Oscillatoriales cyanobacterium]MCC3496500.1 S9 family peptidase [Microcoleus sp. PH2017_15_JOR_U_A]MCC3532778.1 S9 family peptidase [Microcoleus sp. PH2017_25_DOB_D_A]MCC3545179.1 S9 family peptidase [Microcoleus sp. PH2017_24_DOB_U_A]TAE28405.1 MAG: S9 family peptidase [Oscillatoriales cyanobacterium]